MINLIRIVCINVDIVKKNHVTYPSHFWSQERCHFVTRAHMYYCMYFYPNVYSLKLVKHRVIYFIYYWEIFFLSNATFIKKNYSMQNKFLWYFYEKFNVMLLYPFVTEEILKTSRQRISKIIVCFTIIMTNLKNEVTTLQPIY